MLVPINDLRKGFDYIFQKFIPTPLCIVVTGLMRRGWKRCKIVGVFLLSYICRQAARWQRPVPTCSWQSPLSETFCRPGGRTVNGLRGRTDIRKRSDKTQWLKSAISYQICYLLDWLFGGNSFRTKKYESKEFIMLQPKRVTTKIEASFVSPL